MMSSLVAFALGVAVAAPAEASGEEPTVEQSTPEPSAMATEDALPLTTEARAERLYEQGNEHFVQRDYTEALQKYQAAIELWDHPAIRFNMAECYVSLVQPLKAYENLELALAAGPEPLESQVIYERGLELRGRLLAQLGRLTVTNVRTGIRVTIDGQAVDPSDGQAVQVVLPGGHQVVASAEGFVTATTPVVLAPGEGREVAVDLEPLPPPLVTKRRWPRWMPWTVLGAGVGIAVAGFPLLLSASSDYDDYDRAVAAACSPPDRCPTEELPPGTLDLRKSGDLKLISAQVLWAVGGAAVVTGAILLVLNRPRAVRERRVTVGATVGPRGAALSGTWRF